VAAIFAVTNGYLDRLPVNQVKPWEMGFHRYLDEQATDLLGDIREKKQITDDIRERLVQTIQEYQQQFEAR